MEQHHNLKRLPIIRNYQILKNLLILDMDKYGLLLQLSFVHYLAQLLLLACLPSQLAIGSTAIFNIMKN